MMTELQMKISPHLRHLSSHQNLWKMLLALPILMLSLPQNWNQVVVGLFRTACVLISDKMMYLASIFQQAKGSPSL